MSEPRSQFILDVEQIRQRAREKLEHGAVTAGYGGSVDAAIGILNDALATELLCVLRYRFHASAAQGINSEGVRKEFAEHAREEQEHADMIARRITQLGGRPHYDPSAIAAHSATQYIEGENLIDMIKEDLVAERIAIDAYRKMIRYFSGHDPTTRRMLETILATEEEHAEDMHDLLVAREGEPMLEH